jgi:membrane associated rhomboid family serine protease
MIPLQDDNPTRSFPVVTVTLIALNCLVFFYQLSLGKLGEALVYRYGAIPCVITYTCKATYEVGFDSGIPFSAQTTLLSSMFLHGGFFHLIGNMLYLWIFGNNVEDSMGHFRFTIFYLLCGIIAALSHILTSPSSRIPMIGASGAISGVLGAYLFLYPHAKILTLLIFGFFIRTVRIPALFVLGFWIVIQFINGTASLGGVERGGTAWFAHIGGFIAGLFLIHFFKKSEPYRDEWQWR